MPYRQGPFLAGSIYHVLSRGVDRQPVFLVEPNYRYFLDVVRRNMERRSVDLVAYCLMPNHFHLLLRPRLDDALRMFMSSVLGSYAQAVNHQQDRCGPLFQGRYRCARVEGDDHLAHVARYIHLNPVRAGLVVMPEDWPHSNYRDVVALRGDGIQDDPLVPGQFATGEAYRQFVCSPTAAVVEGLERVLLD